MTDDDGDLERALADEEREELEADARERARMAQQARRDVETKQTTWRW